MGAFRSRPETDIQRRAREARESLARTRQVDREKRIKEQLVPSLQNLIETKVMAAALKGENEVVLLDLGFPKTVELADYKNIIARKLCILPAGAKLVLEERRFNQNYMVAKW